VKIWKCEDVKIGGKRGRQRDVKMRRFKRRDAEDAEKKRYATAFKKDVSTSLDMTAMPKEMGGRERRLRRRSLPLYQTGALSCRAERSGVETSPTEQRQGFFFFPCLVISRTFLFFKGCAGTPYGAQGATKVACDKNAV
jgi:hypothetical protein